MRPPLVSCPGNPFKKLAAAIAAKQDFLAARKLRDTTLVQFLNSVTLTCEIQILIIARGEKEATETVGRGGSFSKEGRIMNFSDYLFFTQRLTCAEYLTLTFMQNPKAFGKYDVNDTSRKCDFHLNTVTDLEEVHRVPFGDVLRNEQRAFEHLKAVDPSVSLDGLLREWRQWHVNNLEPIATYSLTTKIGRELFKRRSEKKLVGRHVAGTFIGSGDIVCIPEGSSATYVGLGIGLLWQRVQMVTSNEPLLREYRENPEFAPKFKEMIAIGGHVDDSDHGGAFGNKCEEDFEQAIKRLPGATTVIMPVTGLLPDSGPYGGDDSTRKLKLRLIEVSLGANVRSLIFVTDYTKHLPSKRREYGQPVFNRAERWQQVVKDHSEIISIVTAPPPEIRRRMARRELGQALMRALTGGYDLPTDEKEYDEASKQLARQLRMGTAQQSRFIEVFE